MRRQIDMKATGKNLRRMFITRGLTTKDVSEMLGYDATTAVLNWTGGKVAPRINNLIALSDILGVSLDDIVVTTGEPIEVKAESAAEIQPEDLKELQDRLEELREDIERVSVTLGRFAK